MLFFMKKKHKPHASYGCHTVTKLIEDLNDNNFLPKSISIGRLHEGDIIEKIF